MLLRAQVILILSALIPTVLTTPLGIILLASGDAGGKVEIVIGVLVLAFTASSVTGFIISGIFLRRGSALVRIQHDFLSLVSHELRTPMTSMRIFIDALLDDRLTDAEERARCLRTLRVEIDRLDELVDRLIELSRLETEPRTYASDELDAELVIAAALAAFEAQQVADARKLEVETTPGLRVIGDQAALVDVLVNLLANARKYAGPDASIKLQTRLHKDREIEFVVTDDGPGIPADEQRLVFQKFWRGKSAIESGTRGSGLGLAIVRAIVKNHGGRIELRCPAAGGTAFHVFLPRARGARALRETAPTVSSGA